MGYSYTLDCDQRYMYNGRDTPVVEWSRVSRLDLPLSINTANCPIRAIRARTCEYSFVPLTVIRGICLTR